MLDWPWPFVILPQTGLAPSAYPVCFIHKAGGIGSRRVEHLNALFLFRSALILLETISSRRSRVVTLRTAERKYQVKSEKSSSALILCQVRRQGEAVS